MGVEHLSRGVGGPVVDDDHLREPEAGVPGNAVCVALQHLEQPTQARNSLYAGTTVESVLLCPFGCAARHRRDDR